jgi:hypothetical protein
VTVEEAGPSAELASGAFVSRLWEMSPFPTRERKAVKTAPQTAPADAGKANDEETEAPSEFQPESGALAPREATAEEQLERDPREDL